MLVESAVSVFPDGIEFQLQLWGDPRKTGAGSSVPPEGIASSSPVWGHAAAPFALLGDLTAQFVEYPESTDQNEGLFGTGLNEKRLNPAKSTIADRLYGAYEFTGLRFVETYV
jgi:hypothetical protein